MSTRSSISLKLKDGTVKTVYCHFDGYIENVGKILFKNYKTYDEINALLELGDISILNKSIERPTGHCYNHPADGCTVFYKRDRGESDVEFAITDTFADADKQEYNYIFENGFWNVEYNVDNFIMLDVAIKIEDELREDDKDEAELIDAQSKEVEAQVSSEEARLNLTKTSDYKEYICVNNQGIEDSFTESSLYCSNKKHDDSDMIYVFDNAGEVQECFIDRFEIVKVKEVKKNKDGAFFFEPDECDKCGCESSTSAACPYQSDVNGVEEECNCCEECRYQCAQDI